ncbi:MAG TPA: hypothetical protein VK672_07515 [Solirubrobacteraceae bacterium]|jgi:hypothetical protein|nr:hypothetical protein [Solirubrobacteraceae bacterium]
MGVFALVLMVLGWILILVAAFGSGLTLHIGTLSPLEAGFVLVLLALCLGAAPWAPYVHRNQ